jgi:rod shape-determining protein mreC
LQEENEKLKQKNSELEQSLRELEIIKSENNTLKEYVNLKEKYNEFQTVPAYVINKDISNYNDTIIINVGSKDGVEVNMPVISEKGLVGHIISVTESTAKVETIIDTASTISCVITTSRDMLIARGTLNSSSTLKATYIPTNATILEGDKIETSGLGGIYPKGIHIGTIKQVVNTKNITDRYAIIETAVNFEKLETVLVIK